MPKKLTLAEFLAKAVAVHGVGRYDYSQVVYVNGYSKVEITCPKHSVFKQVPASHVQGQGCPLCYAERRSKEQLLTTAQFVANARLVHGEVYDYSLAEYLGNQHKVKIICRNHGVFEQSPNNHVNKQQNCPACSALTAPGNRALKSEAFLEKAKAAHGDRYDYSQVIYRRGAERVKFICHKHGVFEQTPHDHLAGNGCPACGRERFAKNQTYTQDEFIARAQLVHEDKYDYSLAVYENTAKNVKIICPEHGIFEQTPTSHISAKAGCIPCGRERTLNARRYDTETFIKMARTAHGNKYDYALANYTGAGKKIEIVCLEHGSFAQNSLFTPSRCRLPCLCTCASSTITHL
jgi:hypothetical protein